jgi:hypothetical protein
LKLRNRDWRSVPVLAFGVLLASAASVPAAATVSLPGSFEVSETGAAAYTIPIAVPPGTAGMTPSLSLSYNSRGGNGLLGMGWSLTGLPAITRCPKTIVQDGAVGGINYDANDRFCLEGERLVATTGTYGANNIEYRTERDGFSKVVSYGTAGTGPASFKVWTKSGQIMEFGNTADSLIEAQGKTTARLWALNKVSDTKGNYFTVSYTETNANGEYRPNQIDYTGNAAAGIAPYASVRFVYEARPATDVTPLYEAGSLIKTTQRLTNVRTFVGETLVSDYRLAYDQGSSTQKSRITSITLCTDTAAPTAVNCLPATILSWSAGGSVSFGAQVETYPNGWNFGAPIQHLKVVGDFNGDGRTDYLFTSGSLEYVFLSNGDSTFTARLNTHPNGWNFPVQETVVSGDFNGDGKTDYLLTNNGSQYVFLGNGDGTFTARLNAYPPGWNFGYPIQERLVVGDFNGDGKTDYLLTSLTSQYVFLSNGDGTFTAQQNTYPNGWSFGSPIQETLVVGDFNGDGKTDYLLTSQTSQYVFLSNGDGTFSAQQNTYPSGWNFGYPIAESLVVGDFNGDGRTDYLLTSLSSQYVFLSNGDGTFSARQNTNPNGWNFGVPVNEALVVGDFNSDGKSDYLLTSLTNQYVFLSNGDGTFSGQLNTYPNGWTFGAQPVETVIDGDFDGDGKSDYLLTSLTSRYSFRSSGGSPDLLTAITTGLGAVTTITYAPLSQGGTLYTKDATATYPVVDVQGPIYVVSQVAASNGLASGTYQSTYSYAGAKAHAQGRGFLGFRQMTVKDQQTLIEQATNYLQSYPYIGLVDSRVKKRGSATLNQTQNIYQMLNAASGTTLSTPNLTSAPYRVQLQQSVESSWELNGTALPVATTTYQYDAYGNATQVVVSTPDGYSKTTTNTYTNDSANWLLGRLTRAQVTSVTP